MTLDEAREVLEALVDAEVEFVVIGAMAMAAQGLPRATQDLDLFVAPDAENLRAVKRALRELFDDPEVEQIDTVRPQDRADAARIRRAFELEDG